MIVHEPVKIEMRRRVHNQRMRSPVPRAARCRSRTRSPVPRQPAHLPVGHYSLGTNATSSTPRTRMNSQARPWLTYLNVRIDHAPDCAAPTRQVPLTMVSTAF